MIFRSSLAHPMAQRHSFQTARNALVRLCNRARYQNNKLDLISNSHHSQIFKSSDELHVCSVRTGDARIVIACDTLSLPCAPSSNFRPSNLQIVCCTRVRRRAIIMARYSFTSVRAIFNFQISKSSRALHLIPLPPSSGSTRSFPFSISHLRAPRVRRRASVMKICRKAPSATVSINGECDHHPVYQKYHRSNINGFVFRCVVRKSNSRPALTMRKNFC